MLCAQKLFVYGRCVQSVYISACFSTYWFWMATEFRWRHLAAVAGYLLNKTKHRDVQLSVKHLMKFRSTVGFLTRLQNSVRDYFH